MKRVGKRDLKRKFFFYPKDNFGKCYRCLYVTRDARAFIARHGLDIDINGFALSQLLEGPRPSARLPEEYSTRFWGPDGAQAIAYLDRRGLSRALVAAYELGYCATGRYQGRIIIPVYEQGVLSTFQARDYTGLVDEDKRYLNPSVEGKGPLFNLDRVRSQRVMVLVEGPFDALALPEYAVAVMGLKQSWNAIKRDKILAARPYVIFLGFDRDGTATDAALAIRRDLGALGAYIDTLPLASKDLGDAPAAERARLRDLCAAVARTAPELPDDDGSD